MSEYQGVDPIKYAESLIDAGVPVVVGKPRGGWKPGDAASDVIYPAGWADITPEESRAGLGEFRRGQDSLLAVSGWTVDALDFDAKIEGADDSAIHDVETVGVHRTPSDGKHYLVKALGLGKKNGLSFGGVPFGDYCGGTAEGGGRALFILPGSTRPKYPGRGYEVIEPFDRDKLLTDESDEGLALMLRAEGCTAQATPGEPEASSEELQAFRAEHSHPSAVPCPYGRQAVEGLLSEMRAAQPGEPVIGRHGRAVRAAMRLVELMRAGCASTPDLDEWEAVLESIKPEGGSDPEEILRYAIANASGAVGCNVHGEVSGRIDDSFWGQRDYLAWIRQKARSRLVSPYALLGASIVRVAGEILPNVVIPPLVGAESSLNIYVAIYGSSSSGKTSVFGVLAEQEWQQGPDRAIGSPEGITAAYIAKYQVKDDDVRQATKQEQFETSIVFTADEVGAFGALDQRSRGGLVNTCNTLWTGGGIGGAFSDEQKNRSLPPHSARFGLYVGVQPKKSKTLIAEDGAGFLERFLFFSPFDPLVRTPGYEPPPEPVGPMPVRIPEHLRVGHQPEPDELFRVGVCDRARAEVRAQRIRLVGGEHLDESERGHDMLQQLKVAAVFAIWDGRAAIEDEDWELAGVVVAHSRRLRTKMFRDDFQAKTAVSDARAEQAVRTQMVKEDLYVNEVADRVLGILREHGPMVKKSLKSRLSKKQKGILDDALNLLRDRGDVTQVADESGREGRPTSLWQAVQR